MQVQFPPGTPKKPNIESYFKKGDAMKNGKCPKCGSSDIWVVNRPPMTNSMNGNILSEHIPLGFAKGVAGVRHYVCRKCGYLEHYIVDEHIARLPKK